MTADTNYRMERIKRLLHELEYEVVRGMMEGEIDETMTFRFLVPVSRRMPDGVVLCKFETRPIPRYAAFGEDLYEPRLKIVGKDGAQ